MESDGIPKPTVDLERMMYPSKVLITSEKELHISNLSDDQLIFDKRNDKKDYGISKIVINTKVFHVLHYTYKKSCHFIYYDDQLNFVKKTDHAFGFWIPDMTQIHLLSEDHFVCVINNRLNIIDMKSKQMRQPVCDAYGWYFRIDTDKNIVFAYDFVDDPTGTRVRIRTYVAKHNYNKFFDKVHQLNYRYIIKQNLIYLDILDPAIMANYNDYKILDVYKVNNKYHVVNYYTSYLSLNLVEWEFIDDTWKDRQIFFLWNFTDIHKVNLMSNRSLINVRNEDLRFCCSMEDVKQWKTRMLQFLKKENNLNKFNEDLLLLILEYIF